MLSQGSERDRAPVPRPVLLAVAALLVAGVLGWLVVTARGGAGPVPPAALPVATAPSAGIAPPLLLEVRQRCAPVVDDQGRLVLSFTLGNAAGAPADLLGVAPLLPLAGLEPAGTTLAGGTCARAEPDPPATLVAGGAPARVTFRFRLPPGCASPYPVELTAWVRTGVIRSAQLGLYGDLGAVPLPQCPGG